MFFRAVGKNPFEQIVVMIHGVSLRSSGMAVSSAGTGRPTGDSAPSVAIIPEKMTIPLAAGKMVRCSGHMFPGRSLGRFLGRFLAFP
jgi:hypothetical protein